MVMESRSVRSILNHSLQNSFLFAQTSESPKTTLVGCSMETQSLFATTSIFGRIVPNKSPSNSLQELKEADSLCHGNWIEIERKNQYIRTPQELLDSNHISYLDEM